MLEFKILITFRPMSCCLSDMLCGRGRVLGTQYKHCKHKDIW